MGGPLAQAFRAKYPGAYDAVPDAELESAIVKKYPGAYDHLIEPEPAPEAVTADPYHGKGEHPLARLGKSAITTIQDTAKLAAKASGIPGLFREGAYGAIKDQRDVAGSLLSAQFDQYRKAKEAEKSGRWLEMIGHSVAAAVPLVGPMAAHAGERIAKGEIPELMGEVAGGVVMAEAPAILRGARAGMAQRTARKASEKAAAIGARREGDVLMSFPPTTSAPYTVADVRAAAPYLSEQARTRPIDSVVRVREALDDAIGKVEGSVGSLLEAFPEARLTVDYGKALEKAFKGNPRAGALDAGLKEIADLPLNRELTLPELDGLRRHLNAENKAIQKRNSYDQATARKVDPGFAAREAVAGTIRDTIYDYLEGRGVEGVRQLRRDEGSLLKLRNAANRQQFAGDRSPAGAAEPSMVRKAAAELVAKGAMGAGAGVGWTAGGPVGAAVGATAGGAIGELAGAAIKGGRLTRDQMIARAFANPGDRLPVYPTAPPRPPIKGYLPPAKDRIAVASEVDPSGPIPPTLPENLTRERELFGDVAAGPVAPSAERSYLLRWLADDLRDMSAQKGGRMSRAQRMDEFQKASTAEEFNRATYTPGSAGTPTQRMFHALGIKGSRAEIADTIERVLRGDRSKATGKLDTLADVMREAWDGQRFDWELVPDESLAKLGISRKDLESPISTPWADEFPTVHERFFPKGAADDVPDMPARDLDEVAGEKAAGEAVSAVYADQQIKDLVAERLGISPDDLILPSSEWQLIKAAAEAGDWETAGRLVRGEPKASRPKVKPYADEAVHITTPENAASIRAEGFKVGKAAGLGGDDFGPGVYLSDLRSDAGSWWREQLETKNETGRVATESMRGRVQMDAPLVLEQSPSSPYSRRMPSHEEMLGEAGRRDLVDAYKSKVDAGMSKNRALGAVAREAGYDGLVLRRRAGDEIVAFDPSSVKWADKGQK